jgi:hypothetical protein
MHSTEHTAQVMLHSSNTIYGDDYVIYISLINLAQLML